MEQIFKWIMKTQNYGAGLASRNHTVYYHSCWVTIYYFLKGIQKETVKTSKTASSGSDAIKNFFFVSKQVFFFYNVRCFSLLLTSIKMEFCSRKEWQSSPIFLPGEFHGQRSLEGCGPWGHKESNTTAWLTLSLSDFIVWRKDSCWLFLVHMDIHVPSLFNEVVVLSSLNYQGTFPKMYWL